MNLEQKILTRFYPGLGSLTGMDLDILIQIVLRDSEQKYSGGIKQVIRDNLGEALLSSYPQIRAYAKEIE